jgi:hypothetical protein
MFFRSKFLYLRGSYFIPTVEHGVALAADYADCQQKLGETFVAGGAF